MIDVAPSLPSLVAAALYVGVAVLCCLAWWNAQGVPGACGAGRFWKSAGLVMLAFSVARVLTAEDVIRAELRRILTDASLLESRAMFQAPAAILVIVTGAILTWVLIVRRLGNNATRLERTVTLGQIAIFGLAVLFLLRLVSLHSIDTVLFIQLLGPIKLNWILDIGLAISLAIAAARFRSLSRRMN